MTDKKEKGETGNAWSDVYKRGYAEPIGNFMIGFSSLENYINLWTSTTLGNETYEQDAHVFASLKMGQKVNLLSASVNFRLKDYSESLKKEFADIIGRVWSAVSLRNKIAHANWISLRQNGELITDTKIDNQTGEVIDKKHVITVGMLNTAIEDLKKIPEDLHILFTEKLPEDFFD